MKQKIRLSVAVLSAGLSLVVGMLWVRSYLMRDTLVWRCWPPGTAELECNLLTSHAIVTIASEAGRLRVVSDNDELGVTDYSERDLAYLRSERPKILQHVVREASNDIGGTGSSSERLG